MIEWLNDNQGAATVLLTALLIVVTIANAVQARRAVAVARRANEVAERGQLGALLVLTGGSYSAGESMLRFTVTNIGAAPAVNVTARVVIEHDEFPAATQNLQLGGRLTKEGDPPATRAVRFLMPPDVLTAGMRLPSNGRVIVTFEDPFGTHDEALAVPRAALGDADQPPIQVL